MEKKALLDMAQDIADDFVLEMENYKGAEMSDYVHIVDLLLQELGTKVVSLLREASAGNGSSSPDVEGRLLKTETKLEKLTRAGEDEDEDEDEASGTGSSFPNLKYAKPKYKDVESILKFVEHEDDKGGVKLVIMNFND